MLLYDELAVGLMYNVVKFPVPKTTNPLVKVAVFETVIFCAFKVSEPPLPIAEVKLLKIGSEVKVLAGIAQFAADVGLKLNAGVDVHVIVPVVLTIGATEPSPLKVRTLPDPLRVKTPAVNVSVPFI